MKKIISILFTIFSLYNIQVFAKDIDFRKSKDYIKNYTSNNKIKKYMELYRDTMINILMGRQGSGMETIEILRLENCLKEEQDFLSLILQEVKENNLEKKYSNSIAKMQFFWKTTIKMKEDIEGIKDLSKIFFECGMTHEKYKKLYGNANQTKREQNKRE